MSGTLPGVCLTLFDVFMTLFSASNTLRCVFNTVQCEETIPCVSNGRAIFTGPKGGGRFVMSEVPLQTCDVCPLQILLCMRELSRGYPSSKGT